MVNPFNGARRYPPVATLKTAGCTALGAAIGVALVGPFGLPGALAAGAGAAGALGLLALLRGAIVLARRAEQENVGAAHVKTPNGMAGALALADAVVWEFDLAERGFCSSAGFEGLFGVPPGRNLTIDVLIDGFTAPEDLERVRAGITASIITGDPFDQQYRVALAGGGTHWIRTVATFHADESGRITQGVGLSQNISAQKSREHELDRAKRAAEAASLAKAEFLATMSHEIRTPMNGIVGMLDFLLKADLDTLSHDRARLAREAAESLLTIVDDILDFSKIEAGRIRFEEIAFDLAGIVTETVRFYTASTEEKGLYLRCEVDPAVPERIAGDPTRFRQVLANLVSNAIKFTESGGIEIRVLTEMSDHGPAILVEVADTGIGIEPDVQSELFQRFVQADAATTRCFGGTGLGLAVSKQLAEGMGGTIGVRSVAGEGSVFWFTVPDAARHTGPCGESVWNDGLWNPHPRGLCGPPRVLLAEDSAINQELVRGIVSEIGCTLTIVDNGADAVEAAAACDFDVVLMDVRMPKMDGLAAARAIRKLPGPRGEVPIVALTADPLDVDRQRYGEAGMNDYLSKPFNAVDLLLAIIRLSGRGDSSAASLVVQADKTDAA